MISLFIKSSVRLLMNQITLSIVKISGLSIGMATFLVTMLYCLHEWSYDKQHPQWEKIYRYVHRVKTDDALQSFAFTSATTGPALKARFAEVDDFTRIFAFELSLKCKDSEIGFVEKKFAFADENFLQFFSFPLRNGNDPNLLHDPYSVILTPASARKYFGNLDPIGKTLLLNGAIELIVKDVFKANFSRTHMTFDFVASFSTLEAIKNHPIVSKQIPASLNLEHKGFSAFYTYLRLTSASARSKLEEKFPAFIEEFRGKGRSDRLKPTLQSLASIHLNSDMLYEINANSSDTIVLIYIVVGVLILVTAVINYINISTAEFIIRAKNIGLKKMLGIGKGPLVVGHVVETMVVCSIALFAGVIMTLLLIPMFNDIMETQLTVFTNGAILPVLLVYFTTVLLSGLLPAIQILRQDALIAFQGNWKTGQSSAYLRNSLVFLQLIASFVLLSMALLIFRQTDYLLQRDKGFDASQVLVVNAGGMAPNDRIALKHELMNQQHIENVSMTSTPPGESLFTFGLNLPGGNGEDDRRITFYQMFVDENFLKTLGVDLLEGRFFDANVPSDSLNSFVVNQTGAESIHDSLMTRKIEIPNIYTGKPVQKTVVGVIDDFHFASFHNEVKQLILEYNPRYARYLLLRFNPRNTTNVIAAVDRMWKEYSPLLPLDFYFLDDNFAKYYATEQRTKQIVMVISLLAVCLASLGIFGTSLFTLQQRRKEIGVRKLLGSATAGLFFLLFRSIFIILIVACTAGVPVVMWAGERWLGRYPYHIDLGTSILMISFVTIFLVMLSTVSFYLLKIIRVQPAQVLRNQ